MKLNISLLTASVALMLAAFLVPQPALAAKCTQEGSVRIAIPLSGDDKCIGSEDRNPIWEYTAQIIKAASRVFGLLVILMIIVSGIQYITSQGNSEQYKNAKTRLTQAVIGLILYILMFGILDYLIPGGILD